MAVLAYLAKFLVYYTAVTVAFYMLSLVVPKAAFVARALAAYLSLLLAAGSGVFTSIAMRLLGCAHSAQWAVGRCFAFLMALSTGIRFEIQDPHNVLGTVRPAVYIGNHQTELDVLMLGSMFPRHCSMTAKSSLKKTPVLGWFMTLSGAIFINRTKANDAREAMRRASTEMRDRQQSVYLFPEGTRSYSKEPELLPFKKGAFHLAVEGQVPIVPCVVANYSHVLWIKGLVFRSGTIPIRGKTLPLFWGPSLLGRKETN
jgi:lysophosphatidate acyltransferase